MKIFPAIDLYDNKAVRLYKGNYDQMTVYSENPLELAKNFAAQGAEYLHLVDLAGAKDGTTPHLPLVSRIAQETNLFTEIGGGIRSMETVRRYLDAGVDRVILGTAAVEKPDFTREAVEAYGEKIAIGIDVKDGFVAVKGWLQKSQVSCEEMFEKMQALGVKTVICTDISRDGAMQGTNRVLYGALQEKYNMNIVASGGVSTLEDVKALRALGLYGAIIGKAYYIGAIDLQEAMEAAR